VELLRTNPAHTAPRHCLSLSRGKGLRLGDLILTLRDFLRLASTCIILLSMVFPSLPRPFAVADSGQIVEFTVGAAADNYADSMYPNSMYGNRLVLYVGNSVDRAQNLSGPGRIYIQFDLSTIPRHTSVVSAEMSLYQLYAPTSSQSFEVHMVRSAWNETKMNWKTQPASDPTVLSASEAPPASGRSEEHTSELQSLS